MSKKTRHPQALETIDLGALEAVSGGRTSATAAAAKSGSAGTSQRNSATAPTATSSDPMMQLLTQIESSLQSMQQNNSDDPFMKAMLAMQMMNGYGRRY